jgi:hypothetical protein
MSNPRDTSANPFKTAEVNARPENLAQLNIWFSSCPLAYLGTVWKNLDPAVVRGVMICFIVHMAFASAVWFDSSYRKR